MSKIIFMVVDMARVTVCKAVKWSDHLMSTKLKEKQLTKCNLVTFDN